MRSTSSRIGLALVALLVALVSLAGISPADAVGTGAPVITAPDSGHQYYDTDEVQPTVDFGNAPYAVYTVRVQTTDDSPVGSEDFTYDSNAFNPAVFNFGTVPTGTYKIEVLDKVSATVVATTPFSVRGPESRNCTLIAPSKIVISKPSMTIKPTLASNCVDTTYAAWPVYNIATNAFAGLFEFQNGVSTSNWTVLDSMPKGAYHAAPFNAYTYGGVYATQNDKKMTVKLGSRLNLSATRSGSKVIIRTSLNRYFTGPNAYMPWKYKSFRLQTKSCLSCAWTSFKTVKSDSHGRTITTLSAPSAKYYRAVAWSTSTIWGASSAGVKR